MKTVRAEIVKNEAEIFKNRGNSFLERGKMEKAIASYNKALAKDPKYPDPYNNIGVILQRRGNLDEAAKYFNEAIRLKPTYAEAISNMGTVLVAQGNPKEAAKYFKKALKINPGLSQTYYNLGSIGLDEYNLDRAASYFRKALKINPDYTNAHSNLGAALRYQNKLEEAMAHFRLVVELEPDVDAYYNLGVVLADMGDSEEAIGDFEHCIRLKPDHQDAYAHLIDAKLQICDWYGLTELVTELNKLTQSALAAGTKPGETPFMSISWFDDPKRNFEVSRAWSREISRRMTSSAKLFKSKKSGKKIRIGYISNNFRNHPVGRLLMGLFKNHNRRKFEIYIYSYAGDDGSYKKSIKNCYKKFVDISKLSNAQAAELIHRDGLDILIDLNGHTQSNRLEICAFRPAPIQISYLGFPGTSGSDFFDYVITDKIVTPPDQKDFYSEKFIFLPGCYQISRYPKIRSDSKLNKEKLGLSKKFFVFCSFNRSTKVNPMMFGSWMRILSKVPNSVLWLLKEDKAVQENLRQEAKLSGIDPKRLIFTDKVSFEEHLKRLKLADIALDTSPYSGGATTTDALWAGVPAVTLQGKTFLSRMTSSMLTAIGLPELITHSLKEYENLAVSLAKNPKELKRIKNKLKVNKLSKPLFNARKFTKELEKAYRQILNK